jgi:sugar-specific transcriptional regulator TrmB
VDALRRAKVSQEQQKVLKTLTSFGLTEIDAEVYIFLAKKGAQKGLDIRNALKLTKEQLYSSLRDIKSKGIISSTLEHPARFSALPFEKVLDLFLKAKMEETQRLQQNKDEILSNWNSLEVAENDASSKFSVIEGRNYIYSRIQQMIQDTSERILAVTTVPGLMQADQRGIFDASYNHPLKSKIQFRFLAEVSQQNINIMKTLLKETANSKLNVEGRTPDLGLSMFPQMVIRDEEEALFFIRPRTEKSIIEQDDVCLWTDCKTLVQAFSAVFEELWHNATDIEKKIIEMETGKSAPKTCIIADAEIAEKKYNEMLRLAKEEIIMITSSKALIECWKNKYILKKQTKNGVSVKIMAPIVCENFEVVEQLSKFCAIKHTPMNSMGTTIVDQKHLFQFNLYSSDHEEIESPMHFKNTFYTDDPEYVKKMENMLNGIWKNSLAPSNVTLESIIGPQEQSVFTLPLNDPLNKMNNFAVIEIKPPKTVTEKDIVDRIIKAEKIIAKNPAKDISRMYSSFGMAVFHSPDYFNLPDMMIQAVHVEKQSSFGSEDYIRVFLWLETPSGHAFVPVAVAGDNPKSLDIMKIVSKGTPAEENIQRIKEDEIQIRIQGNTLFAGWTVPIRLYPAKYSLPPACIIFEGYGDVKTRALSFIVPSGFKHVVEENYFDAFVTFIHPSSKYSGPGTDGFFYRDSIVTNYPPS